MIMKIKKEIIDALEKEKGELGERIERLAEAWENPDLGIDPVQRMLMEQQREFMLGYKEVLAQRLLHLRRGIEAWDNRATSTWG